MPKWLPSQSLLSQPTLKSARSKLPLATAVLSWIVLAVALMFSAIPARRLSVASLPPTDGRAGEDPGLLLGSRVVPTACCAQGLT